MSKGKRKEANYHAFKKWLHTPRFVIIVPATELLPWSWEQKLTPSSNQLVEEQSHFTVQVHFVSMFPCDYNKQFLLVNLYQRLLIIAG